DSFERQIYSGQDGLNSFIQRLPLLGVEGVMRHAHGRHHVLSHVLSVYVICLVAGLAAGEFPNCQLSDGLVVPAFWQGHFFELPGLSQSLRPLDNQTESVVKGRISIRTRFVSDRRSRRRSL